MATAAAWLVLAALWAAGALRPAPTVVFLAVVAAAATLVAWAAAAGAEFHNGLRRAQRALLLALFAAMAVVFDPLTSEVVNLPRLSLVVTVASALAALVALEALRHGRGPTWRNGLHWPVLALVAWTTVATATSVAPPLSVLGAYGSYDGWALAVALALVFFATAQAFGAEHLKLALAVVYFAGGGPVVVYGLIQLHDRIWDGARWDWVEWGPATHSGTIWSTFANPNHLAGFVAVLLPLGVVLALLYRRWWVRAGVAAMTVGIVLELLHARTRGAWLAALVALAMVAAVSAGAARRRPRTAVAAVGLFVVMLGGAAAALEATTHDLGAKVRSAFDLGGNSTAVQRVELWQAAASMANDRPVVGTGPDTFHLVHPRYQSAKFVRLYGSDQIANGAHNLFMNTLATHGYPGLAILVAVVGLAGLRGLGAWRRLGALAAVGDADHGEGHLPGEARLVLAGIGAGLVAYLVQASFNTQQVGLAFVFWALLGLLCVATTAAGVPITVNPTRLLRPSPEDPRAILAPRPRKRANVRSGRRRGRAGNDAAVAGAAAICSVVVVVVATIAAAPYRADRHYRAALVLDERAKSHPANGRPRVLRARSELKRAISLNAWEPTYLARLGENTFELAMLLPPGSAQQLAGLGEARSYYRRAADLSGADTFVLEDYARVLFSIYTADPSRRDARSEAIAVLRRAVRANPADAGLRKALRQVQAS